jgi:hydrogenase expression/formation protein HypD
VCGTHTMAIARSGLRAFLPPSVDLVSGPGCPVCVTPDAYVDASIRLALDLGASVATFGDMVRVPGTKMTLEQARSRGGSVRIVYSPLDAVEAAKAEPRREWVFLAVGFETTAPGIAATVRRAREEGVRNFSVLCGHKTVPPALHALLDDPAIALSGFLCPGHVSVVIGPEAYEPIARRGSPCVVTGFEPLDILQGLVMLANQRAQGRSEVEIQYFRAVKPGGNPKARAVLNEVFEPCDAQWRGIGTIPGSGLALREAYRGLDAARRFGLALEGPDARKGCSCGEILKGVKRPQECPLFGRACRPETPVGPCMVSSEGSCAAAYKYARI